VTFTSTRGSETIQKVLDHESKAART